MSRARPTALRAIAFAALAACGETAATSGSSSSASASATGSSATGTGGGSSVVTGDLATDFIASELLGRPTSSSVTVNVIPAAEVEVYFEYGATAGDYAQQTAPALRAANAPFVDVLAGLTADTAYHYRMRWRSPGADTFVAGPDRTFHTARKAGETFRFTVQADSHLDENASVEQYHRTLENVLADAPDFHIDLGDTFMCEKHSEPLSAVVKPAADEPTVVTRYVFERDHFGLVAHSVPLFLVNGNHEGELGYLYSGSGNDLATWVTRARKTHYLNPTPDAFYSGDTQKDPVVGERAAWYAWTWGDALFVALDPFWNTKTKPGKNPWSMTLGKSQYDWLVKTLGTSTATHKFVFLHNLVGGLDGQQRGGVEAAPYFEWGGANADGTPGFAQNRPGWSKPIHQVLVDAGVTAVFHGHDHVYVHQELDGIVYQAVPQPSAKNTNNGAMLAQSYHYDSGTAASSAGHLRITVAPTGVTSDYVRAWLPSAETPTRKNGQIEHTWSSPK